MSAGTLIRRAVRTVFRGRGRLPGGLLRGTAPRQPSASSCSATTGHIIRNHIDDTRQSPTPGSGAREVRDTVQSECQHRIRTRKHTYLRYSVYDNVISMCSLYIIIILLLWKRDDDRSW